MIKLKELISEQIFTGADDITIIKDFFVRNNIEEEGMDLMYQLSKSKIEKMNAKDRIIKEWTSHLPSKYLYEKYDLDIAERLHTLELDYLSNGCELSESRLKWAKENIPNIKIPEVYFQPLIEYLDSKDIRFKGEKPIKNKIFSSKI